MDCHAYQEKMDLLKRDEILEILNTISWKSLIIAKAQKGTNNFFFNYTK